jgi:threonine 3-dehydrogenase
MTSFYPGPFQFLDVLQPSGIEKLVVDNNVTAVIHLSGVLSAVGERDPNLSLRVNVDGSR